jgi:hypothetical protein
MKHLHCESEQVLLVYSMFDSHKYSSIFKP